MADKSFVNVIFRVQVPDCMQDTGRYQKGDRQLNNEKRPVSIAHIQLGMTTLNDILHYYLQTLYLAKSS